MMKAILDVEMKLYNFLVAGLLFILPLPAVADDITEKLDGTWIETEQIMDDYPRTILNFKEKGLHFENMYGTSATVEYKATEKKADEFTISFEFRYKVKQGNGRIVERCERPELLFHEENGRPVISEKGFEFDGRGPIIMREYLRKEDFIDGFTSELKYKLNDRSIPPMMKE